MVSQAKVNRAASHQEDAAHPAQHGRSFAADAIELCELQAALLAADFKQALAAGRIGGVLVLAAGAMMFAAAPVLLLALASWFETSLDLSRSASLLAAGFAGAAAGFAMLLAGWAVARRGVAALGRSREECRRNLGWFKQMLTRGVERPC